MKVIAVDDEEDALALVCGAVAINLPEAEVKPFTDPMKALEYAEQDVPDIVFLDIAMPKITGLELAKRLKAVNPRLNVIFTTAYSEYMSEAFLMHASGYLVKPVGSLAVKRELENLRSPVEGPAPPVFIRTFGIFEIYVNGEPVSFSRKPATEVLAYLVDCEGASVSKKELCRIMFDDPECTHKSMDYLAKIIRDMVTTLKNAGADNIVNVSRTDCSINRDKVSCDAFDYMDGKPSAINQFSGKYMSQFEWAKASIRKFYH